MLGRRSKKPYVGVFETSEPITHGAVTLAPSSSVHVEEGLRIFRRENGVSFGDAAGYHNAALSQGLHSELTQVARSNWHVLVAHAKPTPETPLGIRPLWSDEEIDQMVEEALEARSDGDGAEPS